jgi:hypothetical protein
MLTILLPIMVFAMAIASLPVKEIQTMDKDITKLIESIDNDPDPLHSDYTPSVHQLIDKGLSSVTPVLKLMRSESQDTRMRAQRVLEGVTMRRYSFVVGKGWVQADGEQKWTDLWTKLGNLQYSDSLDKRNKSIVLWEQWLASVTK